MQLEKAYLEQGDGGRLDQETTDLASELPKRGVPVELFPAKRLRRRQLPLTRSTLVAGYVRAVESSLRQLGIEPPPPNDYPAVLIPFLKRRIWISTVGSLAQQLDEGRFVPCFVKPRQKLKRFTGFVLNNSADLFQFNGAFHKLPVYCCDPVQWLSEYRAFVVNGRLADVRIYCGDPNFTLDEPAIQAAITQYEATGDSPAAYGIDFGVLASGETALIEVNDGYSLGSYGLDPAIYTDLIVARWLQLVK